MSVFFLLGHKQSLCLPLKKNRHKKKANKKKDKKKKQRKANKRISTHFFISIKEIILNKNQKKIH